jgi:hypothetical protein
VLLCFGYGELHQIAFHPGWEGYGVHGAALVEPGLHAPVQGFVWPDFLAEFLADRYARLFAAIAILQRQGAQVAMVAGPPPHRASAYIQARQPRLTRLPDPGVRLALHRAMQRMMAGRAAAMGFRLIDVSSEFEDADGFLAEAWQSDGVHGNEAYGVQVLTRLSSLLQPAPAAPA